MKPEYRRHQPVPQMQYRFAEPYYKYRNKNNADDQELHKSNCSVMRHFVLLHCRNSSYTDCSLCRKCSTAYRFLDRSVLTLTPVSAANSLKLRPSISCSMNTRRCCSGNSSSAVSSSSISTIRA